MTTAETLTDSLEFPENFKQCKILGLEKANISALDLGTIISLKTGCTTNSDGKLLIIHPPCGRRPNVDVLKELLKDLKKAFPQIEILIF